MNERTKTLEQLENDYWGEPPINSSSLVSVCYKLRKKRVEEFEAEDLRIMINQNIGLIYLIPISITVLKESPFTETSYYEGDLLKSVLSCDSKFWKNHQNMKAEMSKIVKDNFEKISKLNNTIEINSELEKIAIDFINK